MNTPTASPSTLAERDLRHVWHPCSQMKDYESFPPLPIVGARGSNLFLADGHTLIDASSSWWCKSLGHGHPRLKEALTRQAAQFEHVLLANTTNETIVRLSEKLCAVAPGLDRVFYASDGCTAVEIALKLSFQSQQILGRTRRTCFMALANGYHGESLLTLSLSDLGIYRDVFSPLFPPVSFLKSVPYVLSTSDPLWSDCSDVWPAAEQQLEAHAEDLCAILVEPILQGAGGMLLYSADFLRRLRKWTSGRGVHLIADEIVTGLGRTGRTLACDHAGVTADFVCLSKSLTAGWLPMSAVLTSTETYKLFYDDYATAKAFMHSNTYAGNPIAASVALEALTIYEEEDLFAITAANEIALRSSMMEVADQTGRLVNVRALGGVVAADLKLSPDQAARRAGYAVYQEAVRLGALLRPLGNTLYWLLPLNVESETIARLQQITTQAIRNTFG